MSALPVVVVMIVLGVIDIAMGVLAAYLDKSVSSQKMREGFAQKAALLLSLVGVAVVDPLVAFPLTVGFATGFALSQLVSIVENAGRLGVDIPKDMFDRLVKLRGEKAPIKHRRKKPPDLGEGK
ncbi:holin [bacterium]|nr:MAG: holin [bacterium]